VAKIDQPISSAQWIQPTLIRRNYSWTQTHRTQTHQAHITHTRVAVPTHSK